MKASQINPEKYGGDFEQGILIDPPQAPQSMVLKIVDFEVFETKETPARKGVSIKTIEGERYYTTRKSAVNFLVSEKTNLRGLLVSALGNESVDEGDRCVEIYFYKLMANTKRLQTHASFYAPKSA